METLLLPPPSFTFSKIPRKKLIMRSVPALLTLNCHAVGNAEYSEEPATSVKFPNSISLPDCSCSLSLLGTGMSYFLLTVNCFAFDEMDIIRTLFNLLFHSLLAYVETQI